MQDKVRQNTLYVYVSSLINDNRFVFNQIDNMISEHTICVMHDGSTPDIIQAAATVNEVREHEYQALSSNIVTDEQVVDEILHMVDDVCIITNNLLDRQQKLQQAVVESDDTRMRTLSVELNADRSVRRVIHSTTLTEDQTTLEDAF